MSFVKLNKTNFKRGRDRFLFNVNYFPLECKQLFISSRRDLLDLVREVDRSNTSESCAATIGRTIIAPTFEMRVRMFSRFLTTALTVFNRFLLPL